MPIVKKTEIAQPSGDDRQHGRDIGGLLAQLNDPNPAARRWAVRDLEKFPEASTALTTLLSKETDSSVREVILTALTTIGDPVAIGTLMQCLRSEDAALRNEAIDAMKELPDEVAPIMSKLLEYAESDVRLFAVNILAALRWPDVEHWLIDVLANDEHINVCAAAIDALVEVGTAQSQAELRRVITRFPDAPYIVFAANLALSRIAKD